MSVEAPKPVPRKRNIGSSSSSSLATRTSSLSKSGSTKDLDVRGLRSKLDEMSMQQLRDVLEDAAALHTLISSLNVPQLASVQSNKEAAAAENRRLAEQNLESKPELEELRNELMSVESTVRSLMDTYTQYYEHLAELVKKLDNQKAFSQLQRSVSELESQTEGVAENFLAAKINEEQFMDQYMQARVSYWQRKVKAEKMEELLNPTAPPKLPPKRSQPQMPSPYRATRSNSSSAEMPTPSHPRTNTMPGTIARPPPTQQQPYTQPVATQQPPYRPTVPPVSAAPQATPYTQPPTQYQPQRPQYQYPPQRPVYQYPQQPQYQQPPRTYAPQATYRPPAYPQQPYPGYQQPRPAYYPYQQQPYRYR